MRQEKQDGIRIGILLCCIGILSIIGLLPKQEVQAATVGITAGVFDTVSVFDKKASELKNLSFTSSNRDVKVRKKTYTVSGVKHTTVLAWAPYSAGEDEKATVTIKYYDNKKKRVLSVKKQVSFLPEYNGGYKAEQTISLNDNKRYTIRGSAKLDSIYSSIDRYESSMFAPFSGGGDGDEICSVTVNKRDKTFRIFADAPGEAGCYVAGYFNNGEISVYRFEVNVPGKDGSIFTRELKLGKDQSTILYFTPPESGKLSVQVDDQEIATATVTEDKETKEAALVLAGLKEGRTEVRLIYDAKGKALINKYIVQVLDQSPLEEEVYLTPVEEEQSYTCTYALTDMSGNLIKSIAGRQSMEIIPDSTEVTVDYYSGDTVNLRFSRPGTYHITVKLKDLEGNIITDNTLTITAGELNYSDKEQIGFTTEAEAKAYFCDGEYRSWSSGEYRITFRKDDVITAIWGSNPWIFKSGDYAPGDATYAFDLRQQKIIVKDYDRTLEIAYEIIAKKHVRLTIEGKTLDFIYN